MLKFLNPLTWLNGAFSFLGWLFGPILRAFGYFPHPDTEGFENIEHADVEDAERLAAEQEAAVDEMERQMSPAEVVHAYSRATEEDRLTMDLGALGEIEQDWLLNLSDVDLILLGGSGVGACARSLEQRAVLPNFAKIREPETQEVEILAIPTSEDEEQMKRDFVSARFRELFYAPGVPNPKPRFAADTLH